MSAATTSVLEPAHTHDADDELEVMSARELVETIQQVMKRIRGRLTAEPAAFDRS